MAFTITSMRCKNPVTIKNSDAVNKSYPGFWNDFVNGVKFMSSIMGDRLKLTLFGNPMVQPLG